MLRKLVLILTISSLNSIPSLAAGCPPNEYIKELANQHFDLLLHEDNYCFYWNREEEICRTKWKFMPWHGTNYTDTYEAQYANVPPSPDWYYIYKNPCSYAIIPPKTNNHAYVITFGQPKTD